MICDYPASPRKTTTARLIRTMSASLRRPIRVPSFNLGTVMILSIMIWLGFVNPLVSVGSTVRRNSGASVPAEVKPQTVMDCVVSKRSSWMMTAGLGFPA